MTRTEHLLWKVAEECAETAQRASKAARFGMSEVQPGQELTNGVRLLHEFTDLCVAIDMLGDAVPGFKAEKEEFSKNSMVDHIRKHRTQIEQFLDYSKECGALEE